MIQSGTLAGDQQEMDSFLNLVVIFASFHKFANLFKLWASMEELILEWLATGYLILMTICMPYCWART